MYKRTASVHVDCSLNTSLHVASYAASVPPEHRFACSCTASVPPVHKFACSYTASVPPEHKSACRYSASVPPEHKSACQCVHSFQFLTEHKAIVYIHRFSSILSKSLHV